MALIVEDGTGVVDANSYVSVDDAVVFFDARGLTLENPEQNLLRGLDILESQNYKGLPELEVQYLNFPRKLIYDASGIVYPVLHVPSAIRKAQMWMAYYISQGSDPAAVLEPSIKKEKIDVLETEYFEGKISRTGFQLEDYPHVYQSLQHLLRDSGLVQGIVYRA